MCFRRKIDKARAIIPLYSLFPGLPRVIMVHHVYASHTPLRLSTIPPRMLLIATCWQSKLSHTRPRHGYESLSTRQFNVFAASGSAGEIFQYAFSASRRIRVFFQLILKERRIHVYEIATQNVP